MFFSLFEFPHFFTIGKAAREHGCGLCEDNFLRIWRKSILLYLFQISLSRQVFLATTCFPQRQDERECALVAAGKLKSRGQEELWFCYNYISSKARTRGCFGVPLELLKEQDRLLPMLTLNRK